MSNVKQIKDFDKVTSKQISDLFKIVKKIHKGIPSRLILISDLAISLIVINTPGSSNNYF